MNTTRKRIILSLGAICLSLISVELGLRAVGLHELPIYESSDKYEYRFVPNQRCTVIGKNLIIKNLGLRGELPDGNDDVVVWYWGDSVINGGIRTDEDSLATTIWDDHAENHFGSSISTVNISQGSWGPENTLNFCKQHRSELGTPTLITLCVSSHDWSDRMTFCYDGHTKDKPSFNYGALANVLNKYFGRTHSCVNKADNDVLRKGIEFDKWLQFSRELNTKMVLYLHPTIEEIQACNYNSGGNQILKWAGNNEVLVCKGLEILTENGFRDNIHLKERGQRELANLWMSCLEFPDDIEARRSTNI